MPRIAYISKRFRAESLQIIAVANGIVADYQAQGFDLTLRQLYYQFVARAILANTEKNYDRLGNIVSDGRMTGRIDWDAIVDRTRRIRSLSHWDDPADIIAGAAKSYRVDLWGDQPQYVEVWIEKDALVGVIEGACNELDVPFFSCRGYTSQSSMWRASQRLLKKMLDGKNVTILHLGDHDPSGIDMTRDIEERLLNFVCQDYARAKMDELDIEDTTDARVKAWLDEAADWFHVNRIALNMDQVRQYNPPPNPAKLSDSRARQYIQDYGTESWELDALEPTVLDALVRDAIGDLVDDDLMAAAIAREQEGTRLLGDAAKRWDDVEELLEEDQS